MGKTGSKLDKSKDYYNCVHPPMITGTRIIEKCPPASLHVCNFWPFNHIIKTLAKISPDAVAKFVDEIKVSKEKYHGGEYEGNKISKCLNNIHVLEHILDDDLAQDFVPALQSLKKLNEYVASRKTKLDFKEVIDNFSLNYLALHVNHGLSITPKIHIIMEHIADYCHEFGVSLGQYSDQTVEAVHQFVNQRF